LVLFIFLSFESFSQGLYHPYNLDFEDGEKGKLPRGWTVPSYASGVGYSATLTDLLPHGGKLCFELRRDIVDNQEGIYGAVMQTLDAKPYRGKMVKLRAAVRAEISSVRGSAHLWIRERYEDDHAGLFEMMEDRPVVINTWQVYEISGRIDDDAYVINFGLLLKGSGKAWVDDASFEIVEENVGNLIPPKPISKEGLENLAAFSKLYGCARYFSPSVESQSNDWDRFSLTGVEAVENAENTDKLKVVLNNLFLPLIPELELYAPENKPKGSYSPVPPKGALKSVALGWKHVGPPTVTDNKVFFSKVENIYKTQREKEGSVFQILDAVPLQGKEIKFSASVRTYLVPPSGQAQLWLRIDKEEDKPILTKTMDENPIDTKDWKEFSITAVVPANAKIIRIGYILIGEGSALFDDAKLAVIENGKETKVEVKNPGFEDSDVGTVARGWMSTNASGTAGYTTQVTSKYANTGSKSVLIATNPKDRVTFPELKEPYTGNINENLNFRFPLNMFVDSVHTLPYPPKNLKEIKSSKPEKFEITAKDRTSRLALVVQLWNIYAHFNLFNDNEDTWDAALREGLTKAATDRNAREFLVTLEMLTAKLNDANARAWFGDEIYRFGLPFTWKWLDGKLVIMEIAKNFTEFKPGDIVTEINGVPSAEYIANIEKRISASSDGWRKLRALAEIRAGKENTSLKLKTIGSDNKSSEKEILRYVSLSESLEKRPPEISTMNNGIYYIDLTRVDDKIFKTMIDTLVHAKGIIFDMRGISLVSEHALGLFASENMKSIEWQIPIYTKPFQSIISFKYITNEIKGRKKLQNVKLVFLTDERTIGYAEGMISIIKTNKLGEVVGSRTAGTCGEVAGFRLPGNYNFSWTIIKGQDINENVLYGKGIEPTVQVTQTIKAISEGRDEVFEKATEILNK